MKKLNILLLLILIGCSDNSGSSEADCTTNPTLKTEEASEITDTTAKLKASITAPTCESTVTSQGFVYGIATLPKIDDNVAEVNGQNVSATIIDLEPNTTYYYRTFFTNPTGTYYGNENTFSTIIGQTIISTKEISGITTSTAVSGGNISFDGGSEITLRGVCWNTSGNPSTSDNAIENGAGTGEFNSELVDLTQNTIYYLKAYATNESETTYGNEIEFKTLCADDTDDDGICDEDDTDDDNDGYDDNVDCDPLDMDINPSADEICDGLDNDCDGQIDEGFGVTCQLQVALDNGSTPCDLYNENNTYLDYFNGLYYEDGIIYNFDTLTCETSVFSECIEVYAYAIFNSPIDSNDPNTPYNLCGTEWTPGNSTEVSLICLNIYKENKYDFFNRLNEQEIFNTWITDNYGSLEPYYHALAFTKDGVPNADSKWCELNAFVTGVTGSSMLYGFLYKKVTP